MAEAIFQLMGRRDYEPTWRAMQRFTESRGTHTIDEFWVVEHPPVFTLGVSGRWEDVLAPGSIPVIRVDRGGQVTYHGPGQVVFYVLLDLKRAGLGVRELVARLERAVVRVLSQYGVQAEARPKAPGVYVDRQKIAALGLRIRRGCSYHGLSVNVDMNLAPFQQINPCGDADLETTDMKRLGIDVPWDQVASRLGQSLASQLGYSGLRTLDRRT